MMKLIAVSALTTVGAIQIQSYRIGPHPLDRELRRVGGDIPYGTTNSGMKSLIKWIMEQCGEKVGREIIDVHIFIQLKK